MSELARYVLFIAAWLNLLGGLLGAVFMPPPGLLASVGWVVAGALAWAFLLVVASAAADAAAIAEKLGASSGGAERRRSE